MAECFHRVSTKYQPTSCSPVLIPILTFASFKQCGQTVGKTTVLFFTVTILGLDVIRLIGWLDDLVGFRLYPRNPTVPPYRSSCNERIAVQVQSACMASYPQMRIPLWSARAPWNASDFFAESDRPQ